MGPAGALSPSLSPTVADCDPGGGAVAGDGSRLLSHLASLSTSDHGPAPAAAKRASPRGLPAVTDGSRPDPTAGSASQF